MPPQPPTPSASDQSARRRTLALTSSDQARLEALGLTTEDYDFFVQRFVGDPFDGNYRRLGRDYVLLRRPIHARDLIAHLAGAGWWGTKCRLVIHPREYRTDYFAIDLDEGHPQKDGGISRYLLRRYDAVLGALGKPTYVFRSSANRGLHLYYLLDRDLPLDQLCGDSGAVRQRLASCSLTVTPGTLELFPNGGTWDKRHLRWKAGTPLRLPFGAESALLDPDQFIPFRMAVGRAGLPLARRLFENGKVDVVDANEVLSWRSRQPKKRRRAQRASSPSGRERRLESFHDRFDREYPDGLTGRNQLNGVVFHLVCIAKRLRASAEEAREAVTGWIASRHNNHSDTYNRSPSEAFEEVADIVQRLFESEDERRGGGFPLLSEFEVQPILDLARQCDLLIPTCKRYEILPHDLLRFAFSMTRANKTKVRQEMERLNTEVINPRSKLTREQQLRAMWPSQNQSMFAVPIPWAFVERMDGFTNAQARKCWKAVRHLGLWPKAVNYSTKARRATTYRVELDFGVHSAGDIAFESVDEVIAAMPSEAPVFNLLDATTSARLEELRQARPWRQTYPVFEDGVIGQLARQALGIVPRQGQAA